jgi:CubicO group peptidase (beta-lactamase class C family)
MKTTTIFRFAALLEATLIASCLGIAADTAFNTGKTDATAAGMNGEMLARIPVRMKEFVDAGKTAGIVTLVARHGHVASLEAVGYQDLDRKTPMRTDSIFRIMSVTKPVTCAGVMVLVDEGRLSLLDPVERFVPEFKGVKVNPCGTRVGHNCELVDATRPMTVLDLMTHTSGLGERGGGRGGAPEAPPNSLRDQIASAASRATLLFQPGTAWNYSNFGIAVLGRIIEAVSDKPYDQFMNERLFQPLEMNDTFYEAPAEKAGRVCSVYSYVDGKLRPLVRPQAAGARIPSPDSGLMSTAADLARFNQMVLNKGRLNGKRVLSAAAVEAMTTSQTGEIKAGYAAGVGQGYGYEVVREPLGMYRYTSIGSFEKAGVYRTYVWGDPAKDLIGIILMQRNTGGPAADLADEVNIFMAMAAAAVEP